MKSLARCGECAAVALFALVLGSQAAAQTDEQAGLRERQEALFEQMFSDPDNLELMFQHALVSIELRDYEAAITTLERMLIFNPDLSRAKVELGAAYFRLGAYENARFYFDDVLANDDPPDEVRQRVQAFLDEIARRSETTGFAGVLTLGVAYSSNANLGPGDSDVLLFGGSAELDEQFVESDDIGFRATALGRHFFDLNQPDGDVWLTDISGFSLHYLDETRGDIDTVALKTGPRLSLDERRFGPKLRPFAEVDYVRSGNDDLYATFGVGVEYSDTLSETVNIFGSVRSAWREFFDRDAFDGHTHKLTVGATYTPEPAYTFTGILFGETDQTDADEFTNYEFGARVAGLYRYDSGFAWTDRLWTASAYVDGRARLYEEADITVDPDESREDFELRAGLSHVFHLRDGFFLRADADYLLRESNLPNFEIDNFGVALSAGLTF